MSCTKLSHLDKALQIANTNWVVHSWTLYHVNVHLCTIYYIDRDNWLL